MIQCTNKNCRFRRDCLTFTAESEHKECLITPAFKDECDYFYPNDINKMDRIGAYTVENVESAPKPLMK